MLAGLSWHREVRAWSTFLPAIAVLGHSNAYSLNLTVVGLSPAGSRYSTVSRGILAASRWRRASRGGLAQHAANAGGDAERGKIIAANVEAARRLLFPTGGEAELSG
jgi:hypothetical protein